MNLEEILVKLGLDAGAFDRGLRESEHKVKEFGETVKENLADAFKELAAPLAGIGLMAGVEKVFGKVEEIERVSAAAGIGAEEFQKLAYGAKQAGIESAQMEKSLEFLSKTTGEANAGVKGSIEVFNRWGISFKDSLGQTKDAGTLLDEISDRMSTMTDSASQAAMAQDLLGKSGAKMVEILKGGSTELHARGEDASIFTDDDIEQIKKAHEEIDDFGNSLVVFLGKAISTFGQFHEEAQKLTDADDSFLKWKSIVTVASLGTLTPGNLGEKVANGENDEATQKKIEAMQDATRERMKKRDEADAVHAWSKNVQGLDAFMATKKEKNKTADEQISDWNAQILKKALKDGEREHKEIVERQHNEEKARAKEISDLKKQHVAEEHAKRLALSKEETGLQLSAKNNAAYYHTVAELAQTSRWKTGNVNFKNMQGQDWTESAADVARDIENNDKIINKYTLAHGANDNDPVYTKMRDFNKGLRATLEKGGYIAPEVSLAKIQDKMALLADSATGQGININPQ